MRDMAQRRVLAFDSDGWRNGSIYGTIDRKLIDYISTRPAAQLTKEVTAYVL